MTDVDLTKDVWYSNGWGLVFRSVCVPKSWDDARINTEVTRDDPPGTSMNKWHVSEPDDDRTDNFKGTSKIPCPDCDHRHHVLMNC